MSMDLAARALAQRALKAVGETQGADAYEVAVAQGFVGTRAAWLASLQGPPGQGAPGKDAYEVAVAAGFLGDRAAWLASLEGASADPATITALQDQLTAALERLALLESPDALVPLTLSTDQVHESIEPGGVIATVLGRHPFEATTVLSDGDGRLIYAGGQILAGLVGFDAELANRHDLVLHRILAKPGRPLVVQDVTLTIHVVGLTVPPSLDFSKPANSQYLALLEDI